MVPLESWGRQRKAWCTVARPSLRVLVMQYIRCCGSEGLDFETSYLDESLGMTRLKT